MKNRFIGFLCAFALILALLCSCEVSNIGTDSGSSGTRDVHTSQSVSDTATDTGADTGADTDSGVVIDLDIDGAKVRDGGDGCRVQVLTDAEKTVYEAYLEALEKNSYSLWCDNKIGFNYFSTYVSSDSVVNVIYSTYNKTLRVMTEPLKNTALPARDDGGYTKICEPLAISVGLASDTEETHKNGMCYIFRLEDGSFVVYDGGWDYSTNRMSEKIYKVLAKNVPAGRDIVISAWVITHAHTDHCGGFNTFIRSYRDKVTVKNILLNTPNDAFCTQLEMKSKVDYFRNTLKMCATADIIKAHPGQKLVLPGAQIEVLYTLDLYDADTLDEFNTASVVTRITIGGQSFMMTGDMSENSNATLTDMYGSKLKSDFVQVSHHGYAGGTVKFYNLVKADYVLWPASKVGYDEMKNKERNSIFKSLSDKRLIVALDNISIITLPYSGDGAVTVPCSEYLSE